jgi:hypothetical protein
MRESRRSGIESAPREVVAATDGREVPLTWMQLPTMGTNELKALIRRITEKTRRLGDELEEMRRLRWRLVQSQTGLSWAGVLLEPQQGKGAGQG